MESTAIKGNQLGILNLVVFVLSAIFIDTVFVLPTETSALLNYIDNTICVFFFLEFCIRFFQAENKLRFMCWGWVDLIFSIPAVSYLRAGRVLRLIRLLRLIRAFRSTQSFLHHVFKNKAQGTFTFSFLYRCSE
jgi:voltage-gated potassium channel